MHVVRAYHAGANKLHISPGGGISKYVRSTGPPGVRISYPSSSEADLTTTVCKFYDRDADLVPNPTVTDGCVESFSEKSR